MSRYWAVLPALLLATGVGCAGDGGAQSGGAGTGGGGGSGIAGGAGGTTGAAGSGAGGQAGNGDATGTAGTGGDATGTAGTGGGAQAGNGGASAGTGGSARGGNGGAGRGGASGTAGTTGAAGGAGTMGGGTGGIAVPAGYKLVWSDEFDVDGRPSSANWKYENGFVRNEEAQWYQPDNATVSGGVLIIEARREQKANPNYMAGSTDWKRNRQYAEYTSSSLITSGLHS